MLIGREPGIPFGRPPLSKTYLRSEEDLDGWYVRPADWYDEHDVEMLAESGSVVSVNPAAHSLVLDSGEELEYQKVLDRHPEGGNRRLDLPGAHLPQGSISFVQWPSAMRSSARPWRIGTRSSWALGFIGCEVAASLTQLGVRVTAVLPHTRYPWNGFSARTSARRSAHFTRERRRAADPPRLRSPPSRGPSGCRRP